MSLSAGAQSRLHSGVLGQSGLSGQAWSLFAGHRGEAAASLDQSYEGIVVVGGLIGRAQGLPVGLGTSGAERGQRRP